MCVPAFLLSCVRPCVYILWREKNKSLHIHGLSGWPRDRLVIALVSPLEPVCPPVEGGTHLLYLIYKGWPLACAHMYAHTKHPCVQRVEFSDMAWDSLTHVDRVSDSPPTRTRHVDMHCCTVWTTERLMLMWACFGLSDMFSCWQSVAPLAKRG